MEEMDTEMAHALHLSKFVISAADFLDRSPVACNEKLRLGVADSHKTGQRMEVG